MEMRAWKLMRKIWRDFSFNFFQLTLETLIKMDEPGTKCAWLARVLQIQSCGHYSQGLGKIFEN